MDATAGTRTRGSDVVKGVIVFGALGPPLGVLLMATTSAAMHASALDPLQVLAGFGNLIFLTPLAYIFGGIPAALSGVVAGLVRRLRPRALAVLLTTSAGAVASGGPLFLRLSDDLERVGFIAAIGACSALLLALLFTRKVHDATPTEPSPT